MRYPDGGGLTAAGRARRERVRLQAAQMYEHDVSPVQVAHRLRVSTKSAYQWRRRWHAGGQAALASNGAGGAVCRLNAGQVALRDQDQRWTLARVTTLIARLFHVRYTLRGTSYLLHRLGYSPQVPIHRAIERDEKAIAAWKTATWVKLRG
jgi:transposase